MRRPAIVVAAVIAAIVVLGLIIIVATLDVNKYRPAIQAQLSKKLNRSVTLGQLSLRLFPLSIRVTDFAIGEPADFASNLAFANAADVSASVGLFSVIRRSPEIESLTLNHPQIELVRNAQGIWNFSGLGAGSTTTSNSNSDPQSELTLKQLKVLDGQVAVTDKLRGKPRTVYSHIDAQLSDFSLGREFGLNLTMYFPGQGKQLLAVTGKGGPLQANTMAIPFTGHLSLKNVSVAALDPGDPVQGTISADLSAKGQLSALQVTGTLTASTLQVQEFALSNVHANCSFSGGVVELSPVTADAYGGKVDGTITMDTKPEHPLCSVKAKLAGADTNGVLSAATSLKNTMYGSLAADTNLSFVVDASSNFARTLGGTVDFTLTNGQLKNVNLLKELSRIGRLAGYSPAQSASGTAIKRFSGTFTIKDGTAVTNNLVGTLDVGSLSANGSVNLQTQGIDMHMTATLAAGMSQNAGGSPVGGLLSTVLANKNGELVLPVLVTGTAEHPVISPDVQAMAKMKMGSFVGKNGAGGILGGILGGVNGQQNPQQQNPVNSILKQFEKKKQ